MDAEIVESQEQALTVASHQDRAPATPFAGDTPDELVARATTMSNALKRVIDAQKLYSNINGKSYVKVEGWTTLGAMLGVLPKEEHCRELEDGSFEATVSLVATSTGTVLGGASALCGVDEKTWKSRDKYARRSMAITRATGKAYRNAFSWIMSLAGYEATPAEEMPNPLVGPLKSVAEKLNAMDGSTFESKKESIVKYLNSAVNDYS